MDLAKLRMMANQIARNLAAQGEREAVAATARHLEDYWDPRMKAAILADQASGRESGRATGLDPIAAAAVARLAAAQPRGS